MTNDDRSQFVKVLTALATTLGKEVDSALLEGYWIGCQRLSVEQFTKAAHLAITTKRFMPRPAELYELATGIPPERQEQIALADRRRAVIDREELRKSQELLQWKREAEGGEDIKHLQSQVSDRLKLPRN